MMMMNPQLKLKDYCTSSSILQILTLLLLTPDVACIGTENASALAANTPRATSETLPTTTPYFGACLNPITAVLTCAFSPDTCPGTMSYVKPNNIDLTICHTPHHVTIGRCKAFEDQNSCLPSVSLCKDPSNWIEMDNDCTIVEDRSTNYDRLTQYPQCRLKGSLEAEPTRCVFSHDECNTNELKVPMRENNIKCLCYDVPTGMCYSSSTGSSTQPTALTSFCAVGPYDCGDGYDFMTAYTLSNIANPPRKCRLCQEEDIGNYNLHETIVQSGGCYNKDGYYIRCALESTECDDTQDETFRSSARLRKDGVATCPADIFRGGVCTSEVDEVDCTHRKGACQVQEKFEVEDTCSLHSDLTTNEPTYYGECRKIWSTGGDWTQYRCVWDRSECTDGTEEYNTASKPVSWFDGCGCENVETGACKAADDGSYYCAVSAYACAAGDTYIPSRQTNVLGLDCRLCHPKRMLDRPTLHPTTAGHGEVMKNLEQNQNQDSGSSNIVIKKDVNGGDGDDDTFTTALIYAGSFGGCFVFTSLAVFVYYRNGSPDDSNNDGNQREASEGNVV